MENHSKVKLRHVEGVLTSASLLVRHHDAIEALPVVRKLSMHVHKAGHGMGALESPRGAEDVGEIVAGLRRAGLETEGLGASQPVSKKLGQNPALSFQRLVSKTKLLTVPILISVQC